MSVPSLGVSGGSSDGVQRAPGVRPDEDAPPKQQKAIIKSVDMDEELQEDALKTILDGLDKFQLEKDVASYIKKEFDRVHGPTWHAVVGRNFGSYVTHETKVSLTDKCFSDSGWKSTQHFIYCYVKDIAVCINSASLQVWVAHLPDSWFLTYPITTLDTISAQEALRQWQESELLV